MYTLSKYMYVHNLYTLTVQTLLLQVQIVPFDHTENTFGCKISALYPDLSVCPSYDASHGHFSVEGNQNGRLTSGTRVTISCVDGYGPDEGHDVATCSEDGQWEPATPKCSGMCYS